MRYACQVTKARMQSHNELFLLIFHDSNSYAKALVLRYTDFVLLQNSLVM
jgi:hypothetical protein